jgi:hypothetical protein
LCIRIIQAKLFLRCPWSVSSALLGRWRRNWLCIHIICRGLSRRLGDYCLWCRRSCCGWLNLRRCDRGWGSNCSWRRSGRRCWALSLPTRGSRRRSGRLLGRRGTIRGLLGNIHGRLNRRRMMLLLRRLLLLRCHVRLRSAVLKLLHAIIATVQVVLVLLVRVAIVVPWLAILSCGRTFMNG